MPARRRICGRFPSPFDTIDGLISRFLHPPSPSRRIGLRLFLHGPLAGFAQFSMPFVMKVSVTSPQRLQIIVAHSFGSLTGPPSQIVKIADRPSR